MIKTRDIILAGASLEVPMLPIRLNKIAYPLCRKLHNEGFLDRVVEGKGQIDCSASEMDDLTELAFVAACAANSRTTREEFDNWPISPPELVDAFFLIRYQTGAWIAPDILDNPQVEAEGALGEVTGAETLPT